MLEVNKIYDVNFNDFVILEQNNMIEKFLSSDDLMSFIRKYPYKPLTETSFQILSVNELPKNELLGIEYYSRPSTKYKIVDYAYIKDQLYYYADETDIITGKFIKAKDFGSHLLTNERIIKDLENQEIILEAINSNIEYNKKQKELQLQKEEKERKEKEDYEFCFGFCDKLNPMHQGKFLKVLNKKLNYSEYGIVRRKDFILKSLQDGGYTCLEHDVKVYAKRKEEGYKIIENYYTMKYPHNEYYRTLTKTEYDYANYLVDNGYVVKSEKKEVV